MKNTLGSGFLLGVVLSWVISAPVTLAQGPPITPSGLNTQISHPATLPGGEIVYDITGGTRPGGGPNLFHSFGDFKVPTNHIANFLNETGVPTSNILGRVTGGNISNIFGTIQTTNFGNANLFLVNPAGFLFGPNATVNVGGMVTFTSANSLRLADGASFRASPNATVDALLSAAPVAAFGFLGSNPGAITIQGSQLSVTPGQTLSLVGGTITVRSGRLGDGTVQPALLSAPSGQINLVSVSKPVNSNVGGEVAVSGAGQGAEFIPTGFKSMGAIRLSQGSTIDTSVSANSGLSAGAVLIRGGTLVMKDSSIKAEFPDNTFNPSNPSIGGSIEVTATRVALSNHSTISTSNVGFGSAGNITFNADTFSASDSTITAAGGMMSAESGSVTIQGLQGSGASAHSVSLTRTGMATGNAGLPHCAGCNNGGPIFIQADNITLNQSRLNAFSAEGTGGSISLLSAGSIKSRDSFLESSTWWWTGGTIDLRAGKTINLINTTISARSNLSKAGTINLLAPQIALKGSHFDVGTQSGRAGGSINVTAENSLNLTDTHLSADSTNPFGSSAGTVNIDGGRTVIIRQSTISAQSVAGNGGTIHVEAEKGVTLRNTELTTSVAGGPQAVGGAISLDAKTVMVKNSELLSTAAVGQGGTIAITSTNPRPISNSILDVTSQSGHDGTVTNKRH